MKIYSSESFFLKIIEKLNKLREDDFNISLLNYLSMLYLFSMMVSYKIHSLIIYILLITFFLNKNIKIHLLKTLKNKFVQACMLYFSIYIIWMIGTEDLSYAFVQIKINKVFLYSILFVAIIRKEFIDKFFLTFFFGLLINVIWSYLIFFNIVDSPFRTTGYLPLLEKIDHAFFVMIGISYSLYRLLKYKDKIVFKMLFFLFICIESFNIFITNNKTMMFLYLLVILITTIYVYRNNIYKILFMFIMFSSFIFIVLNYFLPSVKNNLIKEVKTTYRSLNSDDYNGSMAARVGMAKFALAIISENKLFGLGTGDHALEIIKRVKESDLKEKNFSSYNMLIINLDTGKAVNIHNTYLQILVQFGIIGLIVFLNIFYQIARNVSTKADINSYLLLVILTIILVQFNTGWDFQFGNLGSFFILFVSLLISKFDEKTIN